MKKPFLSYVFIVCAAMLWAATGLFVRQLDAIGFTQIQIVALRSACAAVFLSIFVVIFKPSLFKFKLRDIWCFIGTGIISVLFFNWCYVNTLQRTTMAVASVMLNTSPIFVLLLSVLIFKERLSKRKVTALIFAFSGCVLVTGVLERGGASLNSAGILFGIGSGIGYALYSIFGMLALNKGYSSVTISLYTFIFSALVLPFTGIGKASSLLLIPEAYMGILGIGILCCVLPYLLFTKGLETVTSSRASIIATVEPVTSAVLGWAVFGEALALPKIIGIVCIFFGIVLLNTGPSEKN